MADLSHRQGRTQPGEDIMGNWNAFRDYYLPPTDAEMGVTSEDEWEEGEDYPPATPEDEETFPADLG